MLKEFREFVLRGNVLDMAVGIIIGVAFGAIVQSLVTDLIMPPIGFAIGNVDFSDLFFLLKHGSPAGPYASLLDAKAAGAVTMNYGVFVTTIIRFLIIALAVFLMVKGVNRLMRKKEQAAAEPTTKECPFCYSTIPVKAVRCPDCTSQLTS